MKVQFIFLPWLIGPLLIVSGPADASKKVRVDRTEIDGHIYKVIRYDNNTVKVVEGGMFGKAPGLALRDAMRRAVTKATGCTITDDFLVDAKLNGVLSCDARPVAKNSA